MTRAAAFRQSFREKVVVGGANIMQSKGLMSLDDELLTVQEAAPLFRWRPSTLYEKCKAQEVPHIRLPGGKRKVTIRFTRRIIAEYLANCIVHPNGEGA